MFLCILWDVVCLVTLFCLLFTKSVISLGLIEKMIYWYRLWKPMGTVKYYFVNYTCTIFANFFFSSQNNESICIWCTSYYYLLNINIIINLDFSTSEHFWTNEKRSMKKCLCLHVAFFRYTWLSPPTIYCYLYVLNK